MITDLDLVVVINLFNLKTQRVCCQRRPAMILISHDNTNNTVAPLYFKVSKLSKCFYRAMLHSKSAVMPRCHPSVRLSVCNVQVR